LLTVWTAPTMSRPAAAPTPSTLMPMVKAAGAQLVSRPVSSDEASEFPEPPDDVPAVADPLEPLAVG
jgi:hypothetical protein